MDKKFVFLFLFAILLVGTISAMQVYTENNPTSPTTTDTQSAKTGEVVSPFQNIILTNITKQSSVTATSAYIQNDYGVPLYYAPFVGDVATFLMYPNLTANASYYVLVDNNGSAYTDTYSTLATTPAFTANFTWVWGVPQTGGNQSGQAYSVNALGFTYDINTPQIKPTVILDSPANNSNFLENSNVTFVANITGDTFNLVNSTAYVWWNNGTPFATQTNTTFNAANQSSSIVNMYTDGSFIWNTLAAQGNGAGTNSSFSNTNRTLSIVHSLFYGQIASASVLEQASQTISTNASVTPFKSISFVDLMYNGTAIPATFSAINSSDFHFSSTFNTPQVAADTNVTFFFRITFTDSSTINSTSTNQTIINLGIDDCSVNTQQIMNLSMFDEENQFWLNPATFNNSIKVNVLLYADANLKNLALNFSKFYNKTDPARICLNNALGTSKFFENAQIQYKADSYVSKFYNIQNYTLNASLVNSNITLYDLKQGDNQTFLISYRDSSFLPVGNALIQIARHYIDEGVSKTVEIPLTDGSGLATASLQTNSVIYDFVVTKNGQVLATFNNYVAQCQNPTIQTCEIFLNEPQGTVSTVNLTTQNDFSYTLTYNNNTRTVTTTFVIPSGSVSTVSLNVTKEDSLGTQICSQQITTSSGSLSCVVSSSFGNGTVVAHLYKDGQEIAFGQINTSQTPQQTFPGVLVFMALIMMMTLIGAAVTDNPSISIFSMVIGIIVLFALNVIGHTGFVGAGATILFLIIAVVLVMIKIGKRS